MSQGQSLGHGSEDQAAVDDRPAHADRLVHADRRSVLGADEEADGGRALEQDPAEVAHPALPVAAAAHRRVDPHLLELDGRRRPRGGLGLEEDRPALLPEPRAALADLRLSAPAEAGGVPAKRVEPDLLLVGGRTDWDEQLQVGRSRLAQARVPRLRRQLEYEDGLPRAIGARARHALARAIPELADGPVLAEHHAR